MNGKVFSSSSDDQDRPRGGSGLNALRRCERRGVCLRSGPHPIILGEGNTARAFGRPGLLADAFLPRRRNLLPWCAEGLLLNSVGEQLLLHLYLLLIWRCLPADAAPAPSCRYKAAL